MPVWEYSRRVNMVVLKEKTVPGVEARECEL